MNGDEVQFHRVRSFDVELHVETRGSGAPVVALGGIASSATSTIEFADAVVAAGYRLITYDRRGTYRSTDSAAPAADATEAAERQADDLIAILDGLAIERAALLASCAGSGIALETLCRNPDRITAVVVHEPLTVSVLPNPQQEVQALMRYHDVTTEGGGEAGMRAFLADFGLPAPDDFAKSAEREASRGGALQETVEAILYQPRIEDLRRHRQRIAVAVGHVGEVKQHVFARAAMSLADQLHLEVIRVPGHHSAYFFEAAPFAEAALAALATVGENA
ncbi:MAG: alpha/beta fold hydrolase [Rhodococcus sp. (in: high G+C Gram-positive bacteria)]